MAKDLFPSPHPLTPPHSEEDLVSWLRLLRSRRVGPSTFHRLTNEHGSVEGALEALPGVAARAGENGYQVVPESYAKAELEAGRLAGAELVPFGSDHYPTALSTIADPPPLLWMMGNRSVLQRPAVAVVGARNASSLGTRMARQLAADIAADGYVTVSGLARGIDTAAHLGSVQTGTIAVMAGGVDVIYPNENAVLAQDILENGLRISEQPLGTQPRSRHFPRRNRLISGLALALVVVEAAAKSGSLITANFALEQGREVMAVPGHPFDPRGTGCNNLIRDGATLVRGARDVSDQLARVQAEQPAKDVQDETDNDCSRASEDMFETKSGPAEISPEVILAKLSTTPIAEDLLLQDVGLSAQQFAAAIVDLELSGKVERRPGGMLSRVA